MISVESVNTSRALCERFEGCRNHAYQDGGGAWTIGFGARFLANGEPVREGMYLTDDQSSALLGHTLGGIAREIERWLPPWTTPHQAAALLDFAYNAGAAALHGSTLLALFNAGDVTGAAAEFGKWVHDSRGDIERGLVRRRAAECALFLSDTQARDDKVENDMTGVKA